MNKTDWLITEHKKDGYTLDKGRRTHLSGVSLIQVKKYLRKHLKAPEKVIRIEEDGYRFDETARYYRTFRRR